MAHYVLLPRCRSISPEIRQILIKQPDVHVVDEAGGKALLIDATEETVERLRGILTDWIITRETVYPRSDEA